jgi:transposase
MWRHRPTESVQQTGPRKTRGLDRCHYAITYRTARAEAIAEAVQRPTMKFVLTKTAEQLDLQALHRVRERLVSQRTGIINQIRAFLLERGIAVRQGGRHRQMRTCAQIGPKPGRRAFHHRDRQTLYQAARGN